MNPVFTKLAVLISAIILISLSACDFDEVCEAEAPAIKVGQVLVDSYEASRVNATAETTGTGITIACNYAQTIPWFNATYEDARNACLDAGKRLCTKEEWVAACGSGYDKFHLIFQYIYFDYHQ